MGWFALLSILSDRKVSLLLIFVILSVIIAITLTLFEIKIKRKAKAKEETKEQQVFILKLRKIQKSNKEVREKLEDFDRIIKNYFRENFKTGKEDYTDLAQEFRKMKKEEFACFSEKMIELFYFPEKLTPVKINDRINEFIKIAGGRVIRCRKKAIKNTKKHKKIKKFKSKKKFFKKKRNRK